MNDIITRWPKRLAIDEFQWAVRPTELPVEAPIVGIDKARRRVTEYLTRRTQLTTRYSGIQLQNRLRESTDKMLQDLVKIFAETA